MSVADDDESRVIDLLLRDVTATLGPEHEGDIRYHAAHIRTFVDDPEWYVEKVVEDVQQYFHDFHIDTTWPTCPIHRRYPLWLHGGYWCCEGARETPVRVAKLGNLAEG